MGQAEYIVRFKGDYSALQKDINKIAGETKKLSDLTLKRITKSDNWLMMEI